MYTAKVPPKTDDNIDKEIFAAYDGRQSVFVQFKEELMKIGEASRLYSAQMSKLQEKRSELLEKKKALEKGEVEMTDDEVLSFKKALDRVEIQYEEAAELMQGLDIKKALMQTAEVSRQQSDAMAKQADDYIKCIEVARRIARGDKVPPKDEKKLLEFNAEMYQMAKNMGSMVKRNEKHKEHKSLWKDEDENNTNTPSPEEVVDNMECGMAMPAEMTADTASDE